MIEREGVEIGLGVDEDGVGTDEERDPILIGVAGFLEIPIAIGVDTLADTVFGTAR